MDDENKHPSSIPGHTRHLSRPLNIPTLSGDEYLWEWGGFPQKTPLNTTFGPPGISEPLNSGWDGEKSTTLPYGFNSPSEGSTGANAFEEEGGYGTGGRLRPDRNEPYRFILLIERKTTYFELALFPKDESRRKFGRNEVDDAQIFNERRIEYKVFLDNESIYQEGDLVIRWAGDREVYSLSTEDGFESLTVDCSQIYHPFRWISPYGRFVKVATIDAPAPEPRDSFAFTVPCCKCKE